MIDKDGGYATAACNVQVTNASPVVTAPADQTSTEGASTSFNLGSFSDAGANDNPWAVDVDWGDGSPHTTFNQNTQGSLGSQSHSYADNAVRTVTVKVTDKDGGYGTKTITVGVGTGAFLPPVTNTPVTNKLKNGQVLPVKIQITDCNGAGVNNLSPSIRLVAGDQTSIPDDSVVQITPTSASN